ncbi:MAG: GNAT family protein [Erysipelotrichales bacterium]
MFETKRLKVLKASPEDIEKIRDIEKIPEYSLFIFLESYEEHLAQINDPNIELCTIIEKETNELIGFYLSCLYPNDLTYELRRIAITKPRKGYATEIFEGLFDYTFNTLNYNRFWLDVFSDNTKGIALYESLGMYREGILRENHRMPRGLMDQIIYSTLKSEYEQRK